MKDPHRMFDVRRARRSFEAARAKSRIPASFPASFPPISTLSVLPVGLRSRPRFAGPAIIFSSFIVSPDRHVSFVDAADALLRNGGSSLDRCCALHRETVSTATGISRKIKSNK